jgi:hypothetical protein
MSTINESDILSNAHDLPMYVSNENDLIQKDIKENLVFRREVDLEND